MFSFKCLTASESLVGLSCSSYLIFILCFDLPITFSLQGNNLWLFVQLDEYSSCSVSWEINIIHVIKIQFFLFVKWWIFLIESLDLFSFYPKWNILLNKRLILSNNVLGVISDSSASIANRNFLIKISAKCKR